MLKLAVCTPRSEHCHDLGYGLGSGLGVGLGSHLCLKLRVSIGVRGGARVTAIAVLTFMVRTMVTRSEERL